MATPKRGSFEEEAAAANRFFLRHLKRRSEASSAHPRLAKRACLSIVEEDDRLALPPPSSAFSSVSEPVPSLGSFRASSLLGASESGAVPPDSADVGMAGVVRPRVGSVAGPLLSREFEMSLREISRNLLHDTPGSGSQPTAFGGDLSLAPPVQEAESRSHTFVPVTVMASTIFSTPIETTPGEGLVASADVVVAPSGMTVAPIGTEVGPSEEVVAPNEVVVAPNEAVVAPAGTEAFLGGGIGASSASERGASSEGVMAPAPAGVPPAPSLVGPSIAEPLVPESGGLDSFRDSSVGAMSARLSLLELSMSRLKARMATMRPPTFGLASEASPAELASFCAGGRFCLEILFRDGSLPSEARVSDSTVSGLLKLMGP